MAVKRNAEDLRNLLRPIANCLDRIQSNTCKIAECVVIFKKLADELKNHFLENPRAKTIFEMRCSKTLTPAHFGAFLISPRWSNALELLPREKEAGIQFLEENCNITFMAMFFKFQGKLSPFPKSAFTRETIESMTDLEWWRTQAALFPEIISNATLKNIEMMTTAVASSAGVERTFSIFGLVHSKLRNQLGVEKSSKLVFISQMLNSKTNH